MYLNLEGEAGKFSGLMHEHCKKIYNAFREEHNIDKKITRMRITFEEILADDNIDEE